MSVRGRREREDAGDRAHGRERLGELLVRSGVVTAVALEDALDVQRREGGKLGAVLVRLGMTTEERIAETLARQKGLEHVDLSVRRIDRAAASLLPERLARRHGIIPIGMEDGRLVLAMADPLDIASIDDTELRTGHKVRPVVATASQIRRAVDRFLTSNDVFLAAEDEPAAPPPEDEVAAGEDVPIVRLVNQLIRDAVREGATDIHVEPMERSVRIRYRVDGVMHEVTQLPSSARPGVTSRLKIMAEMDIAERRLPQDGRIGITLEGRRVDMRVATLPTPYGESVVIRLLDTDGTARSLEDLGMSAQQLDVVRGFLGRPHGVVLLTGPTGSGKTTTLYAALNILNVAERKIFTVEDPIEYRMEGLTQMAVHPRIGLTFAAGLRTILRSDPDVVMIGEIRDPETAEIAVRAGLTGHLVLSSLHANDAPSALTRLNDIGVPPYITSSALIGIVAQRLARKLCDGCKAPALLGAEELTAVGFTAGEAKRLRPQAAVGCERCAGTGYKGRVGLFEVMRVSDELRRESLRDSPAERLREIALAEGMRSLRRDALDKVAAGVTSMEEMARVVV
ncbi:MAG: Flp pilus assembly complex ATPase component TadA [Coriobacteriia bacterium]|nr:Flp pilus assembly complex ATPase component TadA [Coriobacteriia bacterium]